MTDKEQDTIVKTYRDVPVYVSERLTFYARINGVHHSGGSWDTLKKKLDAALTFEPFDAIRIVYERDAKGVVSGTRKPQLVRVVAIKQVAGQNRYVFDDGDELQSYEDLYKVEAFDQITAFLDFSCVAQRQKDVNEARVYELNAALPRIGRADKDD